MLKVAIPPMVRSLVAEPAEAWTGIEIKQRCKDTLLTGTRDQLLSVLYLIESHPAFWSGDGTAIESSALRRCAKRWRRELSVFNKVPTPKWAERT